MRVTDDGDENTLPKTTNTFDQYQERPSDDLKERILYYANKFIDRNGYYLEVLDEYEVPKN